MKPNAFSADLVKLLAMGKDTAAKADVGNRTGPDAHKIRIAAAITAMFSNVSEEEQRAVRAMTLASSMNWLGLPSNPGLDDVRGEVWRNNRYKLKALGTFEKMTPAQREYIEQLEMPG